MLEGRREEESEREIEDEELVIGCRKVREERADRSTKRISEGHITIARSGKKCAAIGETGIGCVRSKHFLTLESLSRENLLITLPSSLE